MANLETLDYKEVAKELELSVPAMQEGLKQQLFPFGCAIKMTKDHIYYVNKVRYEKWKKGEL